MRNALPVHREFKAGAERLKTLMDSQPGATISDVELKRLSELADRAQTEGAIDVALKFREQASARADALELKVDENEANLKADRLQLGTTYAAHAKAASLTFDFDTAATMWGKAYEQVAKWDDAKWNGMFNQPLDVAFDKDDNFYIVQGHGGTSSPPDCTYCSSYNTAKPAVTQGSDPRVFKFDKNAKYLSSRGLPHADGTYPTIHSVIVTPKGELWVTDRQMGKILVLDTNLSPLREIQQPNLTSGLFVDAKGQIWMSSGILSDSHTSSSEWRTMLSTPPRLRPGDASSLMNTTGTSTEPAALSARTPR